MTLTSTMTEVSAGNIINSSGHITKLFTATTSGGGQTHTFTEFENIYYIKAWKVADGVDAEAFVTAGAYGAGITVTQSAGAIYVMVTGTPVKSTGGST